MGKGARLRRERPHELDAQMKRLVKKQVDKELARESLRFYENETSCILLAMRRKYGFGKKKLMEFVEFYNDFTKELHEYYELGSSDTPFICTVKLKEEVGIDWEEELAKDAESNSRVSK